MRKTYLVPQTNIFVIEIAHMICTSGTPEIFNEKVAETTNEQEGDGYMLSRRNSGSVWDDEN